MKRIVLASTMVAMLTGCTTVHKLESGKVIRPVLVEQRSAFGTNGGFVRLEECDEEILKDEGLQPIVPDVRYYNCAPQTEWKLVQSPGQGGQVLSGVAQGLGFGLMGALIRPSTSINQASGGAGGSGGSATAGANASAGSSSSAGASIINGGVHH